MSHRTTCSALVLVMLTACASVPRVNTATEEAAIRAQEQRLLAAVSAKDVATIAAIYTPDATLMMPNEAAVSGTTAIRNDWSPMVNMPGLQFTFTPTRFDISKTGDLATDFGTYRLTANGPDGRIEDSGSFMTSWRKVNGQWLMTGDIATSDRPRPTPPPATVVIMESGEAQIQPAAGMQWSDLSVPGFAPGMKIAVLHGDPSKAGDYTLRLKFPDNYTIPAHWHPEGEHVTVLQGNFSFGMGATFDRSALKSYGPGDFVYAPAKMPHFATTKGESVVQLHGTGPFAINLVK